MSSDSDKYIVSSDEHEFIGYAKHQGGMVGLGFESIKEIEKFPDCLYAFNVDGWLGLLTRRVESLNHIGDMLWLDNSAKTSNMFPVSRYEWCNVIADVFLMRFVSISDSCLLLANEVVECGFEPKKTNLKNLKKVMGNQAAYEALENIHQLQEGHRLERNHRFHRAIERSFTDDDQTFKTAAIFEFRGNGIKGTDRLGREIDLGRFFEDAMTALRNDFNCNCRALIEGLDHLYDELDREYSQRFSQKFRSHDRNHSFYGSKRNETVQSAT